MGQLLDTRVTSERRTDEILFAGTKLLGLYVLVEMIQTIGQMFTHLVSLARPMTRDFALMQISSLGVRFVMQALLACLLIAGTGWCLVNVLGRRPPGVS